MEWYLGEEMRSKELCLFKKGEITDETYKVKRKFMIQERGNDLSVSLSRQEQARLSHASKHLGISPEKPCFFWRPEQT